MGFLRGESLPAKMRPVLEPLLKQVESLTEKIKDSDREIEQIARKDYPETALLQQVSGVGPLIALTFLLTVEDKNRFRKSRDIGCYVGLQGYPQAAAQSLDELQDGDWVRFDDAFHQHLSGTAQVVAMLQRKNGATLAEIMEKMGWQKHTVRGFMAGAMKKAGYAVESFKSDKGERIYRINA
jgi:hypothetical protein